MAFTQVSELRAGLSLNKQNEALLELEPVTLV